jgi:transcriptional regulator with XRE-family HTH domain
MSNKPRKLAQRSRQSSIGDLAGRIRQCVAKVREQRGVSLAKLAGVGDSNMARYMSGTMPTLPPLAALAEAAGVDFRWLALGVGVPEPPPPDDRIHLDPTLYTVIPTINSSGKIDSGRVWGFLRTDELRNCIPEFPHAKLAFFRVTEDARGPKFTYGEWLLVDTNATGALLNGDYCLRDRSNGTVFARQVTVLPGDMIRVILPQNGMAPENARYSRQDFDKFFEVIGRILVGAQWSAFEGPS